jgi:hypothetical protein
MDLRSITDYADISLRTLSEWIHDPLDPLAASQVGKKILVRRAAFDQYLERHPVKPGLVDEILKEVCG